MPRYMIVGGSSFHCTDPITTTTTGGDTMHTTTFTREVTSTVDVNVKHRFKVGDKIIGRYQHGTHDHTDVIEKVGTYPKDLPSPVSERPVAYPSRVGEGIYVFNGRNRWDFVESVDVRGSFKLAPVEPDVTYTITIEQHGSDYTHDVTFGKEGLTEMIKSSLWIADGEEFDVKVDAKNRRWSNGSRVASFKITK